MMEKKSKMIRKVSMIIVACIVVSMLAFAGAGAADATQVSTWDQLKSAMDAGGDIQLSANITVSTDGEAYTLTKNATIDLNGKKLILGAETAEEKKDVSITVAENATLTIVNTEGYAPTSGHGGFYNNGKIIAYGTVDVSGMGSKNKWPSSFTLADGGGVVYGLKGSFKIGSTGEFVLYENPKKSPNLISANNPSMMGESEIGAKFTISRPDVNDSVTYALTLAYGTGIWSNVPNPTYIVTGMGKLASVVYSEPFADETAAEAGAQDSELFDQTQSQSIIIKKIDPSVVSFTTDGNGTLSEPSSISGVQPEAPILVEDDTVTINDTTITATPNKGYEFEKWTTADGSALPATVTGNLTIMANFTKIESVTNAVFLTHRGGEPINLEKVKVIVSNGDDMTFVFKSPTNDPNVGKFLETGEKLNLGIGISYLPTKEEWEVYKGDKVRVMVVYDEKHIIFDREVIAR